MTLRKNLLVVLGHPPSFPLQDKAVWGARRAVLSRAPVRYFRSLGNYNFPYLLTAPAGQISPTPV